MRISVSAAAAAVLLTLGGPLAATLAMAQQAEYERPPENSGGLYPVNGEPLFLENCASCHEPAIDRAPTRQEMSARSPEEIYDILKTGSMALMAQGLDEGQIYGVVRYLTGKSPTPNATRPPDTNICPAHPPLDPAAPQWNGWSPDVANSRYQPNPGIAAADIPRLKVKWAFSYPGTKNTEPLLFGGRVYVASLGGVLYSLDADSGCVHWRYDFGGGTRASMTIAENPAAPSGYAIYFGDDRMFVRALDAYSGEELWEMRVDDHIVGRITGSPTLYDGLLYVPLSSSEESQGNVAAYNCCTFNGMVVAVDVSDGSIAWKQKVIGAEPRPTRLNSAGTQMYGPAGAAIWSSPTIDAKRGQLYVSTGDSYTEIEHPTADAIVAMDLKTGEIRWVNQVLANDNYVTGRINAPLGELGPDYDFGSAPHIVTAPNGRDLVVTGNKSSIVYAMDPDTGEMVWETPKLGSGGASGGIVWGTAVDPVAGLVFAPNADFAGPPRGQPGLFALYLNTGKQRWLAPGDPDAACSIPSGRCSPRYSGAATAIPGAVFAGARDGHLRAFASESGQLLWDYDTAAAKPTVTGETAFGGGLDMGGPVIAGGQVFVHSGYNGDAGSKNQLIVFTVGGE